MNINMALLFGNLTRDPELRAMPSGMNVASFSIATNRVFKDKDGKKQEQVDFHNVIVFGKQADSVAQYLKKGSSAFIEGRMQTRSWDDKKSGEKKYRTEVVATHVQFGPRKQGDGDAPRGRTNDDTGNGTWPDDESQEPEKAHAKDSGEIDINPDDIPF